MIDHDDRTMTVRRPEPLAMLGVFALLFVALATPHTAAQNLIDRANALYDDIVDERRSDSILLPALIDLTEPPLGVDTPAKASMAFVGGRVWALAEAWVNAAPQRAMLDALRAGTVGEHYDTAKAFAQRYGVGSGIETRFIRGRMYTELGDPPLLAAADHLYMHSLDNLRCLVHLEATRLAGNGQPIEAMELMMVLAKFGYQMADREFSNESRWGYTAMADAIARMRDIAYTDFQHDRAIEPDRLLGIIAPLHPADGPIRLDRLNFPRANRIAAEQLVEVLYIPRKGVDEARFVPTMVRISTNDRPLRRFSAASAFQDKVGRQKDWFDIQNAVKNVFASWEKAWELDRSDPVLALPFAWETSLVGDDTLVVRVGVGDDMGALFGLRTLCELERVATRQALGLLGHYYVVGAFATKMDVIRPRWVDQLEADPLNSNRDRGRRSPMRYFRPVTDVYLANERAEPQPHTMQVFPGDGTNFEVVLREDQFLVYSTGKNGIDDHGTRMSRDPEALVGDYLVWPPVLSLHRTHLRQIGELD
ncbi:MAG: hypothetical protein K8E66_14405 [Phycisphaerales bacterium]|nr:hypothetical protein [Phycisphaerales bacterium]